MIVRHFIFEDENNTGKGDSMTDDTLFERGLRVRKEVLGDAYVDASLASADSFTQPMQELVTEYCWGAVWTREGLTRKTRSMLNLAMLTALNRPHELKMHVKGALRNGVTQDEIREVLLQATIYAGVPAGVDAFRVAREALNEAKPEG
jgi:4-carboxymuconolactone decarboxylase